MSFVDPSQDPLARLDQQARGPGGPVQTARPIPRPPVARPAPIQAPVASNLYDIISQFLFGAPEFNQALQTRQQAGLANADAAIARMRANNATQAKNLGQMKLGAEALDAQPAPAKPMAPLDLFGGPAPEPPRSGPPTPQAFMARHNAQTPAKQVARPQGPPPMAPQTQAPQQGPGLIFTPPGAPPPSSAPLPQGNTPKERWASAPGAIASALGGQSYLEPGKIEPRPPVGKIGTYVDPLKGILGAPTQDPRR